MGGLDGFSRYRQTVSMPEERNSIAARASPNSWPQLTPAATPRCRLNSPFTGSDHFIGATRSNSLPGNVNCRIW